MKDLFKSLLLCYLITAGVVWPFCSFGQTVGELRFDTSGKIWKRGPVIETFNPIIFWHGGDRRECEQLDSVKSLTIRGYTGPLKLTLKVCQHIYVAVEQPEVTVQQFVLSIATFGRHEGRQLVCLKCLDKRKQIVDYGKGGLLNFYPGATFTNPPANK